MLLLSLALAGTITDATGTEVTVSGEQRIVSLGGSSTETLFALGLGESVVAVDSSSTYPKSVSDRPVVGYHRALSAEGLLSMKPTLIVASGSAGPAAALDAAKQAGVKVVTLPEAPTVETATQRVEWLGTLLDRPEEAKKLAEAIETDLGSLSKGTPANVLFVFSHGQGSAMVAGTDTAAHAMLELVGATNAGGTHSGYKPMTPEGLVLAKPDLILTTPRVLEMMGGEAALWAAPGMAATPAAQSKRMVVMDDLLLLGFGPRVGEAARELSSAMQP